MNKNKIPSDIKVECVAIKGELKTNAKFEFIDAEDKLANTLNQLNETLKNLLKKSEADEIEEEKLFKWKFAALVMDRLFLILSSIYTVITFIVVIMPNPNFYK